jgi:uncharacterized protein (DUF58 family)
MSVPEHDVPPAGEEIHLPGPTLLPILCAAGIALAIVGITLGLVFVIVGVVLFLATVVRWIGDTRRDISQLPPEHRP